MVPPIPFWMSQRQVKAEPINDTTVRLNAPQLPPYEIEIRPAGAPGSWSAALFRSPAAEGERALIAEAPYPLDKKWSAWEAAFELYRQHVVV